MGEILYNQNILLSFRGTRDAYRSDPSADFRAVGSNDAKMHKGLTFEVIYIVPHFGGQNPKTYFGTWINIFFKPNAWNIETFTWKLLHRSQPNFAQRWRPPSALRGPIVYGPNTSQTAILKRRLLHTTDISTMNDQFWWNLARWCIWAHGNETPSADKLQDFKNSR